MSNFPRVLAQYISGVRARLVPFDAAARPPVAAETPGAAVGDNGRVVAENIERVRERIAAAAARAGRRPEEIVLVAVSKIKPAADIIAAYAAGQREFGENYVQEFAAKRAELPPLPGARFHLIGSLQSNKSRLACAIFDCVQTAHSEKLLRRLDEQTERPLDVFLKSSSPRRSPRAAPRPRTCRRSSNSRAPGRTCGCAG